jgi:hypothetical protein
MVNPPLRIPLARPSCGIPEIVKITETGTWVGTCGRVGPPPDVVASTHCCAGTLTRAAWPASAVGVGFTSKTTPQPPVGHFPFPLRQQRRRDYPSYPTSGHLGMLPRPRSGTYVVPAISNGRPHRASVQKYSHIPIGFLWCKSRHQRCCRRGLRTYRM